MPATTEVKQHRFKRATLGAALLALVLAGTARAYVIETTPVCVPDPCPDGCRVFVFFDDQTHAYVGFIEVGC